MHEKHWVQITARFTACRQVTQYLTLINNGREGILYKLTRVQTDQSGSVGKARRGIRQFRSVNSHVWHYVIPVLHVVLTDPRLVRDTVSLDVTVQALQWSELHLTERALVSLVTGYIWGWIHVMDFCRWGTLIYTVKHSIISEWDCYSEARWALAGWVACVAGWTEWLSGGVDWRADIADGVECMKK